MFVSCARFEVCVYCPCRLLVLDVCVLCMSSTSDDSQSNELDGAPVLSTTPGLLSPSKVSSKQARAIDSLQERSVVIWPILCVACIFFVDSLIN